jgi:hypothetical protein
MSSLRHAIYIASLSVFWGDGYSFASMQKGSNSYGKYVYYLICREKIVRVFFVS